MYLQIILNDVHWNHVIIIVKSSECFKVVVNLFFGGVIWAADLFLIFNDFLFVVLGFVSCSLTSFALRRVILLSVPVLGD